MRFMKRLLPVCIWSILFGLSNMVFAAASDTDLKHEVMQTEIAFAKTMADRNHTGFESFLADEAVFFSGSKVLRGKAEVAKAWLPLYQSNTAPFSWKPDMVEVLASGTLALSTGPVYNPQGKLIARFNSIWRREASGVWRIVFDKGEDVP